MSKFANSRRPAFDLQPHSHSRLCFRATSFALLLWIASSVVPANAAINVVSYWRMGENDPGAANGTAATNAVDLIGARPLTFHGTASYSNDVPATDEAPATTLSVNLSPG